MPTTVPRALRFYLGLFLTTASLLMLQIIQTRILSVVLWYYFAFLIISLAMFGMTAGTVWVYLQRDRFSERTLSHDLSYFASALAVATTICAAIQMALAVPTAGSVTSVVVWIELTLCLTIPFFLSGVVVSLALTRSPFPIGRVYAVDLAGAAAGCLGVLGVLNLTDGPSALLWVSAISGLAAISFASSGIGAAPRVALPFERQLLRVNAIFPILLIAALANGFTEKGLQPQIVKGKVEALSERPLLAQWNTFSRVAVLDRGADLPQMWGPSSAFRPEDWIIEQRAMNIDGDAGTVTYRWNGDIENAGFLKYDITNLAHFLPGHQRAAVIGVGGGRDILSARVFGVPDITGVELNPILAHLLMDRPGFAEYSSIGRLPGLHVYVDEARSWFARSQEAFDVIQMSLIDTWAATGAGAFTLSENGLYTVEAWRIFLRHLTPDGVFTVSRWYAQDNINETGRMVSLATGALLDLGISEPRQHLFLATSGNIATLIVSRSAFGPAAIARLDEVADKMQYRVQLSPDRQSTSPVLAAILDSRDAAELLAHTSGLALDLTPPTDERPFFFNQLPLFDPWRVIELAQRNRSVGAASGNIAATATLLLLFLMSLLLVIRTIIYPLQPAISDVGRRLAIGGTAYFLLIGVGFMTTEMGLLQRMSVFLGHPIYSLSIVLFSLILTTGAGSLLSEKLPLGSRTRFVLWAGFTAAYMTALPFWLPLVLQDFESARLLMRGLICVLAITPAGILMGFGFPTGMRFISQVDRGPTPWFWGINGAAGVLASSFAVAMSIAFGIYVTLFAAGFCYALLIPAGLSIGFRRPTIRTAQVA